MAVKARVRNGKRDTRKGVKLADKMHAELKTISALTGRSIEFEMERVGGPAVAAECKRLVAEYAAK
jgi:hypothetical protein